MMLARNGGMAAAAILGLLLLPVLLCGQEVDTLKASTVHAVRSLPTLRPVEEVRLQDAVERPVTIADAVRRFAGVQLKDYGGAGGLKTVNVRSLGSEHVGIFLDGVQIDNAQNMQVDLGRFALDGISTISLYAPQKSRRLQTAKEYASGAAVYLDSERPLMADGSALKLRLRGGSLGTANPSVQWDKSLGRITLRTAADFLYSNGRYKYPYFDTTLVRENADIRALRLEAKLFGRLQRGEWRLHLYSYGSERGFPGPVIRRASGFPLSSERQSDQDVFVQGSWVQDWSERYSTAVRFKYSNNYTHYGTHPEKNPMAMPLDVRYRQQSEYLSVVQSLTLTSPWFLDVAADLQHTALDSDAGQFVTPRRLCFTGALATRLSWEKFRAAAHIVWLGAWDRFITPNAGGWSQENGFRDAFMPSVSLAYQPFSWLELDAYARRSYRLPSFNDLYYTQMGNSSLVPESALQFGGDIRLSATPGPWSLELRLSPYYNKVNDKIVAIPTASQFRWTMLNIGIVNISGLETRASAAYGGDGWTAEATARYTFQQALDHSHPERPGYGNQIPYVPLHSGGIDLNGSWKGWGFSWNTIFTGGKWSQTANTRDYYIEPWSVTDLVLSKELEFGERAPKIRVSLSCCNIFNCRYQVVQGYPMPGTTVLATVEVGI